MVSLILSRKCFERGISAIGFHPPLADSKKDLDWRRWTLNAHDLSNKNNATVYSSKHLQRLYLGFGVVFFEVKTLSKIRALWIYNTMIFRSKDGFAPWHGILRGSASSAQRPTLCNTSAEQCAPTWSLGSPWSLWDPGVIWLATLLQNSFWQNTCLLGIFLVSYA